jgi:hypothetical protein
MKRTYTVTHKEEVEIDVKFPVYFKTSEYSCVALLDEENYLKVSIIEKFTTIQTEEQQYSVWISCAQDKHEINSSLSALYSGKGETISPEAFDAFYFNARKIVSIQFNKLDNNALPE